jgi:hypothetical protein
LYFSFFASFFLWSFSYFLVEKFIVKLVFIYSGGGAFALPLEHREEAEAGSAEVQPARNTSG